ncbi:MAG: type II secretion system protein [Clostridia bacterium]
MKKNKSRRENSKRNIVKSDKGITLIALVVTIVVLLILAGISLNLVLGNNGLITKAKDAKEKTQKSTVKDEVSLLVADWQIEKYLDDAGLEAYLNSKVPSKIEDVTNNGDGTYTVEKDGYGVTIDEAGNIIDVSKLGPRPVVSNLKVVANSDGTGTALGEKSKDEGETLYITFTHSIEGGTTTVSPSLPYAVTENGTYSFTITGTVSGETYTKVANVTVNQFIPAIKKIGDYVNYNYDTVSVGYSLLAIQSGYTSNQTVAQSTTALQWRILNIDEENDIIDLVSSEPTDNAVYFKGALGYNNGVYLLNDMCASLYSNSSLGIIARSINLVDMEKHLTPDGITTRNEYNKNSTNYAQYGKIQKYTSNKYYPNLYANQLGAGIDLADAETIDQPNIDGSVPDPYNESNAYYITPTTETYTNASSSLTVTQTYYSMPITEINYGEAANVLSNDNYYWVASRYIRASSSYADFGMRRANISIGSNYLFYSSYGSDPSSSSLRPVVSIPSSFLDGTKDESGAWNLKY